MYTGYLQILAREGKGNGIIQDDLVPIGARLGIKL